MHRLAFTFRLTVAALAAVLVTGCVVQETRPQPRIEARQAMEVIPADQRLDVVVHTFDPGIPEDIADDPDALAKKRIYPELRRAEASFFAVRLRDTLERSAQWGAVRVGPESVQFVDVEVDGRIIESTGRRMEIEITARDAAGRVWIDRKRYEGEADIGSYKTEAALKARDPFQNVYSTIANDLLAARNQFDANALRELRHVTQLKFGADLAPEAMAGYLKQEQAGKKGPQVVRVARLPADNDPLVERIERIRERDAAVIDTLDGYYTSFAEQMEQPYGDFRRTSYDEITREERARSSARTRTVLGAAAVLASILVPSSCDSYSSCDLESVARYAGTAGGIAGFLSGLQKYADARTHAQAFGELARSMESSVAEQVVEIEGRTLRLTGTAEEQYRQWREMLREYQAAEAAPDHGEP
ncbi:MAG: hypothetical protein DIU62_001105 [Pseudomonadota bacterium]